MKRGYKETEIGEIPVEWEPSTISKISEINPCRTEGDKSSDIVSFITMSDVSTDGRVNTLQSKKYEEVNKGFTSFQKDDVIIAKITPCFENGKGAMIPTLKSKNGFGSTEFHVVRANKNKVQPAFLFYHTMSRQFRFTGEHSMRGSAGQKRVPTDFISEYPIPLPPLPEQKKIAEVLSSVDESIRATQAVIEQAKVIKQGMLNQLLTKGIGHKKFKQTEIGEIPVEWELRKLPDISKNLDSERIPVTKGGRSSGDIPYYGASGIVDYVEDYIFNEDLLCVSEDGANLTARVTPIAFSISGKTWVNNHAHILRFPTLQIQKYVEQYLNSIDLKKYITGMAQPKLNQAMLNTIPIPIPSEKELNKIVNILLSVDEVVSENSSQVKFISHIKSGLMQDLLSGKKRVKV